MAGHDDFADLIRAEAEGPARIASIHGIPMNVGVHIQPIAVADRVGLQEAAEHLGVDPGLEVVEPDLRDPGLAGVLEAVDRARGVVGGARDAVLVIGQRVGRGPRAVGHSHDRALLVGHQPAAVAGAGG